MSFLLTLFSVGRSMDFAYSEIDVKNARRAKRILNMKKFIRKLCSLRFKLLTLVTIFRVGMTQQTEEIQSLKKPAPRSFASACLNLRLRGMVEID